MQGLFDNELLTFWLFDWLDFESLTERPRFREHSRETVTAALGAADRLATERFLDHYKEADRVEPRLTSEGVKVLPATAAAIRAYAEAGFMAAPFDEVLGGWQMPETVHAALIAHFMAANVSTAGYCMLTIANARLLSAFGTPEQIDAFARPLVAGEALGTMCLSEPQAGSSLADIRTRAVPDGISSSGKQFRILGTKMWISGGDHDITPNIFHLVLAKIPGPDGRLGAGTGGISLFIVPKTLPKGDGAEGRCNDLSVSGLNHKMGFRGTSNCVLNFGDGRSEPGGAAGAIGYLIGREGQGLEIMFHMMNEARIAVGLGAAALAYRAHRLSLQYASQRPQGRTRRGQIEQSPIIEHADVKRMLLAQKCYAEGALSLVLYASRLCDDARTGAPAVAAEANSLLEFMTPIAKTWPSEWGLAANDIAIQVHGGYGYTHDFDVEQLYRDNRLNPIHEGTTGIQGLDLVGRKVMRDEGRAVALLFERIRQTIARTPADAAPLAGALGRSVKEAEQVVRTIVAERADPWPLWHATELLSAFGHLTVAWLLLDQANGAARLAESDPSRGAFAEKRRWLSRFFIETELPRVKRSLDFVASRSDVAAAAPSNLFEN